MKLKGSLIRLVCLLLLVVTVVGVTAVSAAETASSGLVLENMIIAFASDDDVAETAAKELQTYLYKITGTMISDSNVRAERSTDVTSASRKVIFVGNTKAAAQYGVTVTNNNGLGEGWAIKVVGDDLLLVGASDSRGSLYAVYHLLEDVLGVRWWNLWEEYVPSMSDAIIPSDYEDSGEPALAYRDLYLGGAAATGDRWLYFARNRVNGQHSNTPVAYGGEESFGAPYQVHTFGLYFPASKYFAEHPEWYAWSETRQERISHGQLCLSNAELIEEFKAKVLANIADDRAAASETGAPYPLFYDISPNDFGGHCECDACLASREKRGDFGHLIYFVNQIAEEVGKTNNYPDVYIETLAYSSYLDVAEVTVKPLPNVVVRLADSQSDTMQRLDHANNADALARMEALGELCEDSFIMAWDYGTVYSTNGVFPTQFRYQNYLQTLIENNGKGYFVEMEGANNAEFWDMKMWMLAKLTEDPYQDVEALMMDFLSGYYGEAAADYLYSYLSFMNSKAVKAEAVQGWTRDVLDPEWLSASDVLTAHNYFESAVAATKASGAADAELYLNRINAARVGLDRVIIENFDEYVEEMSATGAYFDVNKNATGARVVQGMEFHLNMEANVSDYSAVQTVQSRSTFGASNANPVSYYEQYRSYGEVALPAEVPTDVDDSHIYDFFANRSWIADTSLSYVTLEENAASYAGGSAIKVEYAGAMSEDYTVSTTKALTTSLTDDLYLDPLVADGAYHVYPLEDVLPVISGDYSPSFFGGSVSVDMSALKRSVDKYMDVYLSMKIVGDPTGNDSSNYATFYIDRIIVVESCLLPGNLEGSCSSNATTPDTCCSICGQTVDGTVSVTKVPHSFTYTYDSETQTYTGICSVCGTSVTHTAATDLPEEILTQMPNTDSSLVHVWDYKAADLTLSSNNQASVVTDTASVCGSAVTDSTLLTLYAPLKLDVLDGNGVSNVGMLTYAQVIGNNGNGYYAYKVAEDVSFVSDSFNSLRLWGGDLANNEMYFDGAKDALRDKTVDVYLSARTETATGGLKVYVDRIILVDSCENYCDYGPLCQSTGATCSVCGTYYTQTSVGHRFTEYLPSQFSANTYVAYCDYGCGVYDEKLDPQYGPTQTLPEELSAHAKQHLLQVYRANDYTLGGTARRLWDLSLSRPVIERDFERATESGFYAPLDMDNHGIYVGVVADTVGSTNLGYFSGSEIIATADNTYHLYALENVDVFKAGGFQYFYLFSDWNLQLWQIESDLQAYQGQTVDMYLYLRVDGDPSCNSADKPIYYIDQLIVVEHCENGDACTDGIPTNAVVTFDSNGGTGTMTAVTVDVNGTYTLPASTFTAPVNMAFAGWKIGSQTYAVGDRVTVTGDIVVRPVWEYSTFTVTFDSNGGSAVEAQVVDANTAATEPTAPTYEGYTFLGWYLNDAEYDFSTAVTGDITLYAKWEEVVSTYTVTFETNGGSAVEAQVVDANGVATKPTDPTKSKYYFYGWYLDGEAYDFTAPVTADITLEAKWTAIKIYSATLIPDDMVMARYTFQSTATDVAERGMMIFGSLEDAESKDMSKAIQVTALEKSGSNYIGFSEGIAAKDMGMSQYVVGYAVMNDGTYCYTSIILEYSPLIYARRMVDKSGTAAVTKALCNAMMQYGAAAQVALAGQTSGLMNEGFAEVAYDESVLGEEKFAIDTSEINGMKYKGATLILEGAISYRINLTNNSGKTVYLEYELMGETFDGVALDGSYYYIDGVAARDMDEVITIRPYYLDEAGEKVYGPELVYSGYEYVRRTVAGTAKEATKALAKALAMYIDAANTALPKTNS